MGWKVLIVILLLLILTHDGTAFGRKRSSKCRKDPDENSSADEQNSTTDYYYHNCDPTEFGIVQKIPYFRSGCDAIDIDFSSACIKCGMCLAIAEKINETLIDVHDILPDECMNDTEIELLLRTICDHCFQQLKDLCHYYLDEIGEMQLYEQWLRWSNDSETFPDLSNIMCRSLAGVLRDCRSMDGIGKYEAKFSTYNARVKINAWFDKYGKHR